MIVNRKGPDNTAADPRPEWLFGGNPDAIQAQERAGQAQLINSDRLPTDRFGDADAWTALGFTFGEPDPADPMFCPATLPDGWRREGSDHDMWSYIVDGDGVQRVAVFYKAAFYDRSAHAYLITPSEVTE